MKFISKDDYLLRNIFKIKHKKWELYIITRILHSLNDPDIEYVCQQFVKSKIILTNSGTSALHLSLILSGVKNNNEVLVPTTTFIATVNVILYLGAKPIFFDNKTFSDYQFDLITCCQVLEHIDNLNNFS